MGGRCYFINKKGEVEFGPYCTDNFQIVKPKFEYRGLKWHSVEQAFQSLKFPIGSKTQRHIYNLDPMKGESRDSFGNRVWWAGQKKVAKDNVIPNWESEKIKLMLLLNMSKYESKESYREDLAKTGSVELFGQDSTSSWPYWNPCIQMLIRSYLQKNRNLTEVITEIEELEASEVLKLVESMKSR